jgi:hypothetical protein
LLGLSTISGYAEERLLGELPLRGCFSALQIEEKGAYLKMMFADYKRKEREVGAAGVHKLGVKHFAGCAV